MNCSLHCCFVSDQYLLWNQNVLLNSSFFVLLNSKAWQIIFRSNINVNMNCSLYCYYVSDQYLTWNRKLNHNIYTYIKLYSSRKAIYSNPIYGAHLCFNTQLWSVFYSITSLQIYILIPFFTVYLKVRLPINFEHFFHNRLRSVSF